MKKNALYRTNIADVLIAVIVIAVSVTPLFSFYGYKPGPGDTANIYRESRLAKQLDMGQDQVYRFDNLLIEIKGKKLRIAGSKCPRQICVHTGAISSPGQTIVCVPNKVLVEIRGGGAAQYDAVSY